MTEGLILAATFLVFFFTGIGLSNWWWRRSADKADIVIDCDNRVYKVAHREFYTNVIALEYIDYLKWRNEK